MTLRPKSIRILTTQTLLVGVAIVSQAPTVSALKASVAKSPISAQALADDKPVLEHFDPLASLVALGLNHSLTMENQELTLREVENTRRSAWAALLPTLTLTGGQTKTTADAVSNSSISPSSTTTNALSLGGSWTIWNNYQNIRTIETENLAVKSARVASLSSVNTYIISIINAALQRQALIDLKTTLQDQLQQSKKTREQSDTLVKAGAKTRFEAMDAEIEVLNEERNLMETITNLAAADRTLQVLLNSPGEDEIPEFDLLKVTPYFFKGFDAKLVEYRKKWQSEIERENPDIVASRLSLESSLLTLKQTRLSYFPSISLQVTQTWDFGRYVQTPTDGAPIQAMNTTAVALSFTWQAWDWLTTHRSIQNAEMDYKSKSNTYLDSIRQKKSDIQSLFDQWDIKQKTVETTQLALKQANAQLDYSREMYRIGRITLLEMQQATSRVTTARNDLATRLTEKFVLAANILAASGETLIPEGVEIAWLPAHDVRSAAH